MAATLAVGVLLGAAMILLSLLSVSAPGNASASSIKEPATGDPRSKGNADAPVVITLWSDFQCPGCRTFALNYEPEIERLFVNTGKARYVSRSLAFLGPESFFAAQAAQCAADQRRYWGYTGLLWQRYRGENTGTFSGENLKRFAAELGLDQAAFNSCLDKGQKITTVAAEASFGNSLGIKSTPSVLVNDKLVDGVPTLERIGQMVEAELEKKR